MPDRPEIWFGDLMRVWRELAPNADAALHIARALGIDHADVPVHTTERVIDMTTPSPGRSVTPSRQLDETPWAPPAPTVPTPTLLEPAGTAPWPDEVDWSAAKLLDRPTTPDTTDAPSLDPLLSPNTAGPVLGAMLGTRGPGDEIDVPRLLDELVHCRPIDRLPWIARPSLFRGVRVLVDVAPSMAMLRHDQDDLTQRLRELLGHDDVQVQRFSANPARGCGEGPVRTWTAFEPPRPGTPVLVLGDLGLGSDPDDVEQDWLRIAELLGRRSSRLVALVPYERERWGVLSPALRAAVDLVTWDRSTAVSDIGFRVRR